MSSSSHGKQDPGPGKNPLDIELDERSGNSRDSSQGTSDRRRGTSRPNAFGSTDSRFATNHRRGGNDSTNWKSTRGGPDHSESSGNDWRFSTENWGKRGRSFQPRNQSSSVRGSYGNHRKPPGDRDSGYSGNRDSGYSGNKFGGRNSNQNNQGANASTVSSK